MRVKFYSILLIAFAASFSQNPVNISGTVKDNASNAPVSGATVKLLGKNLASTTDANGAFAITSASVGRERPARNASAVRFLESLGISIDNKTDDNIKLSLYDLAGRQKTALISGMQESDVRAFFQSNLNKGVSVCCITTAREKFTVKLLSTDNKVFKKIDGSGFSGAAINGTSTHAFAGMTASAKAVDSLLVTKSGYYPTKVPLDTLIKNGMQILLTDSAAAQGATIVPDTSWKCFMPDGIPPPELGTAVFTITLKYSAIHVVGNTKFGYRRQFDISGGTVSGSKITATVLTGGLEYELTLSTGSMELEQIIIFKAGSTPILMRNAGVAPAGTKNIRVVLDFEAPNSSSYTWLHTGKFAATRIVDSVAKTVKMEVYDITNVTLPATRVQIKDPAGVANQTWDCLKFSGSEGATVFTENCLLGSSINIGQTKRGSRNIIPITGGQTSGKLTAQILAGGADFQLSGIDARYTFSTNDGEFIIIRNCGSGTLWPVFEARVDGPYNYLNENKYISSSPKPGSGGVSITFSERK
jgi:hypothetical protein